MNRKPFLVALAELLAAYRPHLNLGRPRWLTGWLPTRGNVLFTLVMIALLVAAQTAGALPLARTQPAPAAASTGTIAYQGRLADAAGAPLTGTYNMIFRLYDAATGGTPLWSEPWTGSNGVRVSDGLFNVMLGSLTALPTSQFTNSPSLFLGVTVGTDDEMQPRVQLGSVPFAVQALTVPDGSVTTGKIADGAVTQGKLGSDVSLVPPDGSVTTGKIADGAVTSRKLRPTTGEAGITPCCVNLTENYQDIPGTERTISVETPSFILINATFDFAIPPGGATAVGNVTLDGVRLGRQAIVGGAGIRATAGTAILLELEPGTHKIGLSAVAGGAAVPQVFHHTGYTFVVVSR